MSQSNYGILEVNLDSDQCGRDTAEVSMPQCKYSCYYVLKVLTLVFALVTWLMQLIMTRSRLPETSCTTCWTSLSQQAFRYQFWETKEIYPMHLMRMDSLRGCEQECLLCMSHFWLTFGVCRFVQELVGYSGQGDLLLFNLMQGKGQHRHNVAMVDHTFQVGRWPLTS